MAEPNDRSSPGADASSALPPPPAAGGCGNTPRLISVGIAPLGIISIGIVPMGVVSIGVVPMGVLSIGAVAMGLVNLSVVGMGVLIAGVNVMGVWWTGVEGMGPYPLFQTSGQVQGRPHQHGGGSSGSHGANMLAYPSKEVAEQKARELGCEGVHPMGTYWMPCSQHPSH